MRYCSEGNTDADSAGECLTKAYTAAEAASHPFPEIASCEAALESGWGKSHLAVEANNLFGRKAWQPGQDAVMMPTREFLHGEWVTVDTYWLKFATWADCFGDRVRALTTDGRYAIAMKAPIAVEWIIAVSKVWSTDPRGRRESWRSSETIRTLFAATLPS